MYINTDFNVNTVPAEVIERTRVAFVDTLGVMLAGSRQPVSEIVCDMVRAEKSEPIALIVGQSLRASLQLAAFANAAAAHAMDYDFSFIIGQAASSIIPGLLPLAEYTGATSKEVIAAFIIGCEVCARLARAFPTLSSEGHWHGVGTIGTIAASAAFARLLRAPSSSIPDIIGASCSMAGGISANFGTMAKPLHSACASRNAVLAVLLGKRGFTASAKALEGTNGENTSCERLMTRKESLRQGVPAAS